MPLPTPIHPQADALELPDGRRVTLLEVAGKGTGSIVYRAVLEGANGVRRAVALKLFASVASDEIDQVAMILAHAARRAACVRHPNVAAVYDFGLFRTQPYLVTELVDGVTLRALLERFASRQQRLPLDLALFVANEVAEGLSGARRAEDHEGVQLGLLHLGLSLSEVLLSWRGEVKVTDFELTLARGATSSVRSLRAVAGRASMMAPEVAQGLPGDARSDVFSLGVLLRELLVGPRFPQGITDAEAIRLAREGYVHPITFQPHLPEALVDVITRAIEVEPEARFPNASAIAFELRRLAFGMGVGDGRWFLRRALDRELGANDSEVTAERPSSTATQDDDEDDDEILELPRPAIELARAGSVADEELEDADLLEDDEER